ncbi:MAG: hypothetical protein KAT05_16410 [Spirochaetes bacterium]|nr:hypothetical protein [Spirochaetota bacterium]
MAKKIKNIKGSKEMENFYQTVNIIETLLKSNGGIFNFNAGQIGFKVDIEILNNILTSSEMDKEHFDESIDSILKLIPIILNKKDMELSDFKDEIGFSNFNEKYKTINTKLISKQLRNKFILENTYKTNLIDKFDWSIITKYYDSLIDDMEQLSVAQLRFRLRHPFSDDPNMDKTETFIMECDIYDINNIIEQLNKIKTHLEEVGTQKQK